MNTAPKYPLNLAIQQGNNLLFDGPVALDSVIGKMPKEGKMTVDFKHGNLHGFAKMLALISAAGAKLGAKIITRADWRACAISGQNIPETIRVEFSSPAAALTTIYVAMIPCMVTGNWKTFPEDQQAALEMFLGHVRENGINMFLSTGQHCSGRLMPLKQTNAKAKATVVESIMTAKKAIAGPKGKDSKATMKASPVAREKTSGKSNKPAQTPKPKPTVAAETTTKTTPEVVTA